MIYIIFFMPEAKHFYANIYATLHHMKTIIEPFKIKSVEPIYFNSETERKNNLAHAHYNPFLIPSKEVIIDLLTDSGTSAMSSNQWAGIMQGDESYAGSPSFQVRSCCKKNNRHANCNSYTSRKGCRKNLI